jgi:hypothetical protein
MEHGQHRSRRSCRMCGATEVQMAPFHYCYGCFSRFGSLSQTMMMLLCFNPHLSRERAIEALGSYRDVSAECRGREWDSVHQLVCDEREGKEW